MNERVTPVVETAVSVGGATAITAGCWATGGTLCAVVAGGSIVMAGDTAITQTDNFGKPVSQHDASKLLQGAGLSKDEAQIAKLATGTAMGVGAIKGVVNTSKANKLAQAEREVDRVKVENNIGRDEDLFSSHSSKRQEYHKHNYHKDSYVFDRPTQDAYDEAQNIKKVMSSKVKSSNGQEQPLFSQKNNRTISVITHQDGTVSVGISGNNPEQIAKLQKALDNLPDDQGKLPNGQRKYRVGTETLTEKQGVVQGVGRDGKLSNPLGQCAEPHCATSSRQNPSPITGSITIWRGKPEDLKHAYTGDPKTKFGDDQMDPCPTCALPHNQQIYHQEATKSQNKTTNGGNNTANSTTNQESTKDETCITHKTSTHPSPTKLCK